MTEVSLTVNGTEVDVAVEPRTTLAEALRQNLRLTGTHLGCQHGVCGACTVLVDGASVRSCLVFAVQAHGAEVLTVEGLGRPDTLHPLQAAFRERHALQCGFCTPGFLMSAYELLRDGVDPDDDEALARELSGVVCRCTGYRGIVEAVGDVARAHPDGVPEPANLGLPIAVAGAPAPAPPATDGADPAAESEVEPSRYDLSVPEGEPNEVIDLSTAIAPSPGEAWELLSDFPRATRCLPGVELSEAAGEDIYAGRARLHLGPLALDFAGAARVLERDEDGRSLRAVAAGQDAGGGGVRAELRFSAAPGDDGGSTIRAQARLFLSGRAAQFGQSLVGDVSRQLFEQFGSCVERTIETGEVAEPTRLRGVALAWSAARGRAAALLRRAARLRPWGRRKGGR